MFDTIVFADYSGSQDRALQRRSIALAKTRRGADGRFGPASVRSGLDRRELRAHVDALLAEEWKAGRRVLFGFDHQYAFPESFTRTLSEVTGEELGWEFQRRLLAEGYSTLNLPAVRESDGVRARDFATAFNRWARTIWGQPLFWGANFPAQPTDPHFPYAHHGLNALRMTEQRLGGQAKSIFKIGGNGTVGLQSLSGIPHLHALLEGSDGRYRVHAWPFDGFETAEDAHVMAEIYPTLHNQGPRTDEEDARETVRWAAQAIEEGRLEAFLNPESLSDEEVEAAQLEGWILGVA
jgi:hypothetical protein